MLNAVNLNRIEPFLLDDLEEAMQSQLYLTILLIVLGVIVQILFCYAFRDRANFDFVFRPVGRDRRFIGL